jgi:hypothetical protein
VAVGANGHGVFFAAAALDTIAAMGALVTLKPMRSAADIGPANPTTL